MLAGLLAYSEFLYRWRWVTSVLLAGAVVGLIGFGGAIDWTVLVAASILLWAPIVVRWSQAARASRTAFRDGLTGR